MFTTEICKNPHILKIILFGSKFIGIFYYLIPVILIIMLMIDFSKNVIFADDQSLVQKNVQTAIKRIISIVILFLVPTIVSIVLNLVEDSNTIASNIVSSYNGCLENTENISTYEKLFNAKIEKEKKLEAAKSKLKEAANQEKEKQELYLEKLAYKVRNKLNKTNTTTGTTTINSGAVTRGQAYTNLDETELKKIASLCQQEQGSAIGAAAEASLMANKYELASTRSQFKNLYDYVRNNKEAGSLGSWWLNAGTFMDKMNASSEILTAVKDVIVNGNRTVPLYINEHDGLKDIKSLSTGGDPYNRSNYHQGTTRIYNNSGSSYTFYCFPTETSDPFGYTDSAYSTITGSR